MKESAPAPIKPVTHEIAVMQREPLVIELSALRKKLQETETIYDELLAKAKSDPVSAKVAIGFQHEIVEIRAEMFDLEEKLSQITPEASVDDTDSFKWNDPRYTDGDSERRSLR